MKLPIIILPDEQLWWTALGKGEMDVKMRQKSLELGDIQMGRHVLIGHHKSVVTDPNDVGQQRNRVDK